MKFTVNRSRWLRGESGGSFLLRKADGKMCCLGFLALACGATESDILGSRAPSNRGSMINWPKEILYSIQGRGAIINESCYDSPECVRLMNTNDSNGTDDATKEASLTKIFQDIGIEVTFED